MLVAYAPDGVGIDNTSLIITSDDADEPTVVVAISGDGVSVPAPEVHVDPLLLDFGDVSVGSSRALSLAITNTGAALLDDDSIAFGANTTDEFTITSGPTSGGIAPDAGVR